MSTVLSKPATPETDEVWETPQEWTVQEERIVPVEEYRKADFVFEQEVDFEIEYTLSRFSVEGDVSVYVADPKRSPIRLGYRNETSTLEVMGWGLEVPLEQSADLPRIIGRRFLELYSKAVTGSLHDEERDWLRTISQQMDYHAFAAARKLPRYREATLVRKTPVLLVQFIEDKNVKLDSRLAAKLHTLEPGDRFGAWFILEDHGAVADFQHILLLPKLPEALADWPEAAAGVELPPGLANFLPQAE